MAITTLKEYLQARFNAEFVGRQTAQSDKMIEDFEARDIPGARAYSERAVKKAIRTYFDERGFISLPRDKPPRLIGPNGENYGVNLTFIPRSHPLAYVVNHRFRVSVLNFE